MHVWDQWLNLNVVFYGGINLCYAVKEVPTVKLLINANFLRIIVMIQANSVQGGAEKMCDTLIIDKFFRHLLLKFVPPVKKRQSLITRPNVDAKDVSFDDIDKAHIWLCVKCASFLFYFAILLPDLNIESIWR